MFLNSKRYSFTDVEAQDQYANKVGFLRRPNVTSIPNLCPGFRGAFTSLK